MGRPALSVSLASLLAPPALERTTSGSSSTRYVDSYMQMSPSTCTSPPLDPACVSCAAAAHLQLVQQHRHGYRVGLQRARTFVRS